MPKIPIDFSLGQYEDVNPKLGSRENYNCYPETTPGAVNKTILRSVEGYTKLLEDINQTPSDAIFVDGVLYYVARQTLYSSISPYTSSTSRGALPAQYNTEPAKLVSNGKNILIISPIGVSTSNDYYYDIATATLASIESSDPDFATFGKVKDVVFKDGYYLFITNQILFHGDNVSTGTGISFNPLSFDPLPAASGDGVGVEVANSVAYVFTRKKTFIYQTASTTPFSFARSIGQDLDIGLNGSFAKVSFDDQIFIVGTVAGSTPEAYLISGTSFSQVGNDSINAYLSGNSGNGARNQICLSTYRYRTHRFIHCIKNPIFSPISPALVIDLTETQLKGVVSWHYRAVASGDSFSKSSIFKYLDISEINISNIGRIYALGVRDGFNGATLYQEDDDQSFGNGKVFDSPASEINNGFQYSFSFIRQEGEPVVIKKIRLRFTENIKDAELFFTQDGVTYTSLGSFDLTNIDSKTAEWRRIGRFNEDVAFRVKYNTELDLGELNPQFGNKAGSLIEGYFEV